MKIIEDVCFGIEPVGWHPRQNTDEAWLCLEKETTGELRQNGGSLYEFVVDCDKTKRSFSQAEVFQFMRKSTFGGIRIRR